MGRRGSTLPRSGGEGRLVNGCRSGSGGRDNPYVQVSADGEGVRGEADADMWGPSKVGKCVRLFFLSDC